MRLLSPPCIALPMLLALALTACGGGGTPTALGLRDLDGDGIPDQSDNDLDGDGRLNQYDDDVDNDGVPNRLDGDADNDGTPNADDETPYGPWLPASQTLFVTSGVASIGFGDVPEGQLAGPAIVTIQNDTPGSVRVLEVTLDGTGGGAFAIDTTQLPGASFVLPAGGSATFHATFRPRSATPALGRVSVSFDIGGQRAYGIVHLLGQGNSPALLASGAPSSINFGNVPVGLTGGPGVARLRNDTGVPYTVTSLQLTGDGGGTFTLDPSPLPQPQTPFTLAAGEEVHFHVSFTPRQGVPSIGEVSVDLENGQTARTLALDLLGQGVAGTMSVTPGAIEAGTALAGAEHVLTEVRVRNEPYANGALTLSAIELPTDGEGAFALVDAPALPLALAPGGPELVLTVRFRPTADQVGPLDGVLRIVGDDPTHTIDRTVALEGYAARWQAPAQALPASARVAETPRPTWLAGSSRYVYRDAGPDGLWGTTVAPDDEIVVVDADPDGDPETNDARVLVRWGGLRLVETPSGEPVDAGNNRHVFFLGTGIDGILGSIDDQVHVLDTVGGSIRSLACPSAGAFKSRPTIVDPGRGVVIVAAGVDGGLLASADSLLVYENLLGNVSATGPDQTVGLGVVVPDLTCAAPVVIGSDIVALVVADGSDDPDLEDRALDDGNEGLVFVRDLATSASVAVLALERALARTAQPAAGDGFCRPTPLGSSSCLVATAGALAIDGSDDQLLRVDGIDGAAPAIAGVVSMPGADGLASRPVAIGTDGFALCTPGSDGVYGTTDDAVLRVATETGLTVESLGLGTALAGDGGAASRPVPVGRGFLVPSAGIDAILGTGDDVILHVALDGTVLGTLEVPGGLFAGDRTSATALAGPRPVGNGFVAVLDRGDDALEGTADDRIRLYRDADGDGAIGNAGDDLDGSGAFDAEDGLTVPAPNAHAMRTPLAASTLGHLFTIQTGLDGVPGGEDDQPVLWWLRGAARLP